MRRDVELIGIRQTMEVMNPGPEIEIEGKSFPANKWVEVPVNFYSLDKEERDLFIKLRFILKSPLLINSDLRDCQDGDSILILRRYGGLGDILMQSILFPEIRRQFPDLYITYAIPRNFVSLFNNCTAIDQVIDCEDIPALPELISSGKYNFIGDISRSCIEYEMKSLREKGFVDKHRVDIWAESIGFNPVIYKTCIRLTPDEIKKAREYLNPDGRPTIGFAPYSIAGDRSYPYIRELINSLNERGYRVFLIHHAEPVEAQNCEKLINIDLRLLGAIIKNMDIVISADTGILHYAGILEVPVIGIFGVTDSRARISFYNATALQGKCDKDRPPCWGSQSAFCRKNNTGVSFCMYIKLEEIIEKVEGLFIPYLPIPSRNSFLNPCLPLAGMV